MLSGFQNASRIPELRRRALFVLGMLAVYRLGVHVPTPGIDRQAMAAFFDSQKNTLFGFLNLFSGGALEQFSVFSLGIMPYISASIIRQLLTVVFPYLERLSKEGEIGRRKITQYTRYGTVVLSIIQGTMISIGLEGTQGPGGHNLVLNPGWSFRFMTVITLTAGTAFIMWLGERITENGIGNGISLIIFAGIVAGIPAAGTQLFELVRTDVIPMGVVLALTAFMLLVIGVVVYMERGMRRLPVQYAKRMAGRRMFAGQATYFPMKVNTAGVIPPIFAGALLGFPTTLGAWVPPLQSLQTALESNLWLYDGIFVVLIIFFTYFYTSLTFRPDDVADSIKKQGGYIPGIRPGRQTADFIERVLNRITFGGAIYLSVICVVPYTIRGLVPGIQFQFGGTALLIVVGVALDTVQQIEGHLISRNYEGFSGPRGPRIRGRVRMAA